MKKEEVYVNLFMEAETPSPEEPPKDVSGEAEEIKPSETPPQEETVPEVPIVPEKTKIENTLNIVDITKAFHKTRELARKTKEIILQNKEKFPNNFSVTIAELNEIIQRTNTLQRLVSPENMKEMEVKIKQFADLISSKISIIK